MSCVNGYGGEGLEDFPRRLPAPRDYFLKEIKMNALVIGNTQTSIKSDVPYLPEGNFYCGNGKSVSWIALQDLAEHLGNYRCMDYVRAAFAEIVDSLDMSSGDKAYYKELAGLAAIGTQE
jgi:hypothetical protein